MNALCQIRRAPLGRPRVIALHCSGAGASQWHNLADALSGRCDVVAPEHFGSESRGPWTGEHAFALADEAACALALIDETTDRIHLVGHSYGGGVALHVALSRPRRIASMALYEPSAFHLLRKMNERGAAAYAEIEGLARHVSQSLLTGEYCSAVATFVDYWNGPGAWHAMRPAVQRSLLRWAVKGPLDFRALMDDPTPPAAYGTLKCPVLIMRGEHAPMPSRVIVECLKELLSNSRLSVVAGAGHMGPISHAPAVCSLIAQHIDTVLRDVPAALAG